MKLLASSDGQRVFHLTKDERQALEAVLHLGRRFGRRSTSLSRRAEALERGEEALADLEQALAGHRRELTQSIAALLADPQRCRATGDGCELTLSSADSESLLQGLNQTRIGAWESLGCPDYEKEGWPEPTEKNIASFWALQVTDLFQGMLLGHWPPRPEDAEG